MWAIKSHLLQPLTSLTSNKVNFKWTGVEHKAVDDIKRAVSHNTLLTYPYLNKRFDIPMDARDYHLGAVISHYVKPIAFYSQKLTGPKT